MYEYSYIGCIVSHVHLETEKKFKKKGLHHWVNISLYLLDNNELTPKFLFRLPHGLALGPE